MLGAKLVSYRAVSLPGLKPVWKITNPEDVVEIGDKVFVKLNPANTGLRNLVCADNDDEAVKAARSLSVSTGLKEIMRLRNRAQSAALTAAEAETTCNLFETPRAKKSKTTPKKSRDQVNEMRRAPESLSITLTMGDDEHHIDVLRPVHPNDCVFAEYEDDTISAVLGFLRAKGFGENKRPKNMHLPKGIQVRIQGKYQFIAKYTKGDGTTSQKLFKTIDDALAFQADPTTHDNDDDGDNVEEHDEESDGF